MSGEKERKRPMACSSGGCESGCSREEYSVSGDDEKRRVVAGEVEGHSHTSPRGEDSHGLCIKCKINETLASTHPSVGGGGGDAGRFCADCFRSNLSGKFRFAVTSNAMISPSDNVLVAFSGGTSSRVALQFVHMMQQKAQKNFDASRDRLLPVFGVGVACIDESISYSVSSEESERAINEMEHIVSSLAPPTKTFFAVPTESIFSPDFPSGRDRMTQLVSTVNNVTGKEDLLKHLRMLALQKVAMENGYTKLVLGTCTSRVACHVLEETVKGKGFSLAADVQYVDARWNVPVVHPLRDCLSEELNLLCSMDSLTIVGSLQKPRSGINGLISSFVNLLKEENPSRESTIVRTAGKLTPFSFNRIPEGGDHNDHLASKRRQKKYNLKTDDSQIPVSHCLICFSPMKKSDHIALNGFDVETAAEVYANTCSSCLYQILPKDPLSLENFVSLLPQSMRMYSNDKQQWLREKIQDCLLSDSDDGT